MSKNPITIEVLETIDAIDRRGSFAKAAEELNKATSAVSYAVQKLEEQLDISLFQRQGRRSVLTPAGQLILSEGRDILQTTARLANKAKEVATGWEPKIGIAVESHFSYSTFFPVLKRFLKDHASIEVDVRESVLNGGWEALEQGKVDLVVGPPGPVPLHKGYRAVSLGKADLVAVISTAHELSPQLLKLQMNSGVNSERDSELDSKLNNEEKHNVVKNLVSGIRRVITHDTSNVEVTRSEGLGNDGEVFYVQNIDQKVEAIVAGIGIGHLPRHRVQSLIDEEKLMIVSLGEGEIPDSYLAWKVSNKGKGLNALTKHFIALFDAG